MPTLLRSGLKLRLLITKHGIDKLMDLVKGRQPLMINFLKSARSSSFKPPNLSIKTSPFSERIRLNQPPYFTLLSIGRKSSRLHSAVFFKARKRFYGYLLTPLILPSYIEEDDHNHHVKVEIIPRSKLRKMLDAVYAWLQIYVIEPILISWRFGYLTFNFLPVLLLVPICYFGREVTERDGERCGALWWYAFLTRRMESAGATFIKLAQWAASRSDIFPPQMCIALSKLHSTAEPHSLDQTKKMIRETFGLEISELFTDFELQPMGVGAIAQVYRAKIKPGVRPRIKAERLDSELALKESALNRPYPEYVAIKVLHPHVNSVVARDLKVMGLVAGLLNLIPTFRWLSLPDEVHTFGLMMQAQLDLRQEAQNLLQLRENFKGIFTAKFPRPLVEWVSPQVLVEKYEFGVPIKYFLQARERSPYDFSISAIGLDCFLHMLVFDNFTHADLHPGNIMIKFYRPTAASFIQRICSLVRGNDLADEGDELSKHLLIHPVGSIGFDEAIQNLYHLGYYPRLIFLDAGLVESLNEVNRRNFLDLFQAVAEFDGYKAGRLMIERCRNPESVENGESFALKMQSLILDMKAKTFQLSKVDVSSVLQKVMQMVREHKVKLEGDFVNVVISILILEGIGRCLNPELDLFKVALPILRSYGAKEGKRNGLAGLQSLPGGGSYWLKLWFQLEARQMISGLIQEADTVDLFLFGPFKPFYLD